MEIQAIEEGASLVLEVHAHPVHDVSPVVGVVYLQYTCGPKSAPVSWMASRSTSRLAHRSYSVSSLVIAAYSVNLSFQSRNTASVVSSGT